MTMDAREQRGLQIAAVCNIVKKGGVWIVPSQSGKGKYTVCPDAETPHCSCPDHETTGKRCKHIFAVEFTMQREQNMDGSTLVTSTVTITETIKKPTYKQAWPAYNAAQTNEKEHFQDLLEGLCRGIQEPASKGGRPRIPLTDAVFAAVFKIYSTFSGRRFMSDLRSASERGHMAQVPHYNSIFRCLESEELTPVLHAMIRESSLPLRAVEVDFAADSSGFTTCRFESWYDHKYGVTRRQHEWVKCHLMCGVKTNIVTSVVILDKHAADTKQLPELARATAENFTVREISADKAYASLENYDVIEKLGATPYVPFKSIHTGKGGGLWAKMYHYFNFRRDEFLSHYHKRSNVESTFGMIKAKFRDHVRSKTDTAMKNEVLCKIVCHNICCLIQEMYELGIEPEFWQQSPGGHGTPAVESSVPQK
jgi:transposase